MTTWSFKPGSWRQLHTSFGCYWLQKHHNLTLSALGLTRFRCTLFFLRRLHKRRCLKEELEIGIRLSVQRYTLFREPELVVLFLCYRDKINNISSYVEAAFALRWLYLPKQAKASVAEDFFYYPLLLPFLQKLWFRFLWLIAAESYDTPLLSSFM